MSDDYKYWAFISYSHQDRRWGNWLHRALETYRVPARLAGRPSRDGSVPRRLAPVFRDREELPTSSDLGANISEALRQSRYLIVICSPRAATSRWVNEEVKAFKALGREDRILCLIVDGEPNASDAPGVPLAECFPEAVRHRVDAAGQILEERTEPIAADVRPGKDGRESARLKLIAGLLGVGFDELWQRERRRRFWRRVQTSAAVLALAAGAYATWWSILRAESRELAASALQLIKDERNDEALKLLLGAVPRDPQSPFARPTVLEAQAALDLALARNRLYTMLGGIKYETESVEMSADGRVMATSSRDGTVRLWDTASWTQTGVRYAFAPAAGTVPAPRDAPERGSRPLALHPTLPLLAAGTVDGRVMLFNTAGSAEAVRVLRHSEGYAAAGTEAERRRFLLRSVAFDSGGTRLLSAAGDPNVRVWDWQRGQVLHVLEHDAPVRAAAFSPDGRFIATVCDDGATRLWDAAGGRQVSRLPGGGGEFARLRFDASGRRLGVATNLRVLLWDIADPGTPRQIADLAHDDAVRWIEFSPDGTLLATASDDGSARLWDAGSGRLLQRVAHARSVRRALFAPDGQRFATVSEDREVRLWDLNGHALPGMVLRGHTHFVFAGAFTRDGARLVTASSDMSLRVWDVAPRARGVTLAGHAAPVRQALFMPDGRRVITTGYDRRVLLFDAASGARLDEGRYTEMHPDRVNGLALSPTGDRFVTVSRDRTARLWSFAPGVAPRILAQDPAAAAKQSHDDQVTGAAFSPDGTRIVTTSRDGTARLWDARTALPLAGVAPLAHTDGKPVWGAVFSPDGRLVLTAGQDEQAGIWDAATGKNLRWLRPAGNLKAGINAAVFSPDGRLAATASDDRSVRLWDVASGGQVGAALVHDDQVLALAFHPAGGYLVSGSVSGSLRFWRVSDHRLMDIAYVHNGQAIQTVAFDAKGERIVTSSSDGTAHVWPALTDRAGLLQQALAEGRRICRRTPGTPEWSDVWRGCPADLAEAAPR